MFTVGPSQLGVAGPAHEPATWPVDVICQMSRRSGKRLAIGDATNTKDETTTTDL